MEDPVFKYMVYAAFGVLAVIFSIVLNWLLLRFLKNIGNNKENGSLIRWAAEHKPSIGGISFFILFLLSASSYPILPFGTDDMLNKQGIALLGSVTLGFLVGFVDDSLHISPLKKFLGQLGCAIIMISMGVFIPISDYLLLNYALTAFWVIGIMNSINMLDNMDGITAGVSTTILITILSFILLNGQIGSFFVLVLIGVIASMFGFLYFNWHPAKMYMGDSGSQFLGALLSYVSILYLWTFKGSTGFSLQQFVIPVIVFMVPMIDTFTVSIHRIARGQSPFQGGRDHTTHHLAYCGLKDNQVASTFVFMSVVAGLLAIVIYQLQANWTFYHTIAAFTYVIMVFLGMQYFYFKGKKNSYYLKQQEKLKAVKNGHANKNGHSNISLEVKLKEK